MNNSHQQQQQQQQQQQKQTGSVLTRYRSAPSCYFANLLNSSDDDDGGGFGGDEFEHLFNLRASSPETQRIFSRFMTNSSETENNITVQSQTQSQLNSQFLPPRNNQPQQLQLQSKSNDYSSDSQFMYSGPVNSNRRGPHIKIEADGGGGGGGSSSSSSYSLPRQSSSPAGLFANIINIEKEFGAMGDFGAGKSSNPESSFSSSRHIMPTISETGTKGTVGTSAGVAQFNQDFPPTNSWDDILKCNNASSHDHQIHEGGNRPTTMLSHHLSLPKTSNSEFSSMESLLTDSVPWKIRAKRGFATHPRSIAERVRRTKISERMRKLQELVPNMEKQTNTADMLDLAVDYIKDLQAQVKKLSDNRAKCSCLAKGKS